MGKINLLSEVICNRIAAGEVIDRPYSVVKELVENSIDAGATEIEVYIERGGKELIKVVDNGCGIEQDDMRAAFFSHATSKIANLEDIDHIHTLGFRGEALATIACIAQVELISAVEGKEANKVECDGEFIGKVQPAVGAKGTQITVRNLFFNTPVRYKFMRSDKKEESDITNFITRYILGNNDISFKYYVDGKLALQSYGGGLEEAIAQVYGADYLPKCFKINVTRNDLQISGFISNQNSFKANKTYQSLFLNGRYVVNPVIAGSITNAYAPYVMKRQYPFYVLFVRMPDDMVDVNVHPNKSDVRFVDNALIYGTVYKVISSILDGTAKAAEFVVESSVVPEIKSTAGDKSTRNQVYAAEFNVTEKVIDRDFSGVVGIEKYQKPTAKSDEKEPVKASSNISAYEKYEEPAKINPETDLPLYRYYDRQNDVENNKKMYVCNGSKDFMFQGELDKMAVKLKAEQAEIAFKSCKYRGTLFDTYLLYEIKDCVYIIDQHAAHERLIYDRLCEKMANRTLDKQGMLVPYLFNTNAEEHDFIEKNMDTIWRMGFSVEPFGPMSYRVNEIPADLPDLNLKDFFDEFLSNVGEMKNIGIVDVLKDKIAQTACKHAVKGGDVLTEDERKKLFDMLDGNMGLKCPHGRPVCVKMTKNELEKTFKRKV